MDAIGHLAGGVAHDCNNLLTGILGYCELLLTDLDPLDPRHADVGEIKKAGTRAAGLTRQLLAFSRKQIIEPTRLDLNVVVTEMREMLGRLIGEDVAVVLRLGRDLAAVQADRGQVEQIVMNLAVNARDAMPTGGTLTIETANVDLNDRHETPHFSVKPGPFVALTVSDTGTGMTADAQAHLFEPFYTTKDIGKGTGLGLATIHGIVTRSGGSAVVHSEIGKGTSFKVYLPKADTGVIVAAPPVVSRFHAGGETVLVVDDVEELRELTTRLLERQGYKVLVASNADEALQVFDQHSSIDVILTDVVMPGARDRSTRQLVNRRPKERLHVRARGRHRPPRRAVKGLPSAKPSSLPTPGARSARCSTASAAVRMRRPLTGRSDPRNTPGTPRGFWRARCIGYRDSAEILADDGSNSCLVCSEPGQAA